MSDLLIFDPDDQLLAVLSNEGEDACSFWNAPFGERLNNGSNFEFTVQGDHEDSRYIIAENQVGFMDKDGFFRLFVIKEPDYSEGADGPQIHAVCEPWINELNDEPIEDIRPYNKTLRDALTRFLAKTRVKVGDVAELGINSTNAYYTSVAEAVQNCINTWGGELLDYVTFDGNRITGRYLSVPSRRGADTGKRWEMDKDILSISQKVQSYPKTALYGRGSSLETDTGGFTRKITFADVVWSTSKGDPVDKPKGQEWIGDPNALELFGRKNDDGTKRHRYGFYDNGEQEDPAKLLQETWEALQVAQKQISNFEMDVYLLEDLTGYEHEKVRLGDTSIAINRNFAKPIEVEERVIYFEYDVADPDNTGRVELGNFIDLYTDDERLDKVESELNDKVGIINQSNKPITDDRIENVTPSKVANVIATGLFKSILVEWDFVNTIAIASYELYASQIKGFTPDTSNLVWRGKTGTTTFKAETNQQWYFRVRAINTHGVAGAFSEEVMAQTVKADFPDIAQAVTDSINTAKQQAETAVTAANTATSNAQSALSQSQSAFNNAQTALTTASALQSRMSDVEGNISALQLTSSSLATRISDAEENISTVTQLAQGLQTQVSSKAESSTVTQLANTIDAKLSKTDAANTYATINQLTLTSESLQSTITRLDNLQIGGRNLLLNSDFSRNTSNWRNWGTADEKYIQTINNLSGIKQGIRIKKSSTGSGDIGVAQDNVLTNVGETYTVSAWVYVYSGRVALQEGNSNVGWTLTEFTDLPIGKWVKITHTFQAKDSSLSIYIGSANEDLDAVFTGVKLELGNKATDWSPSPEDMATTSQISQLADDINLRVVSKNDVVNQINLSTESILIDGKKVHITGQTMIDNAVINTAQLANLSVTNAKIANLAVDDAKIANVSVDKLKAGTIDTSKIKIYGGSTTDYTTIDGSFFESRGRFARWWGDGQITNDVKLRFENGYLRARNDTLNRSVYFSDFGISTQIDGINASGTLEFFSKENSDLGRGVTMESAGVITLKSNGGAIFLTSSTTINANAAIYAPSMVTTSTNAYIGADNEVRMVNKGTADTTQSSSIIYRNVRAAIYYGTGFTTTSTNAYVGADGELRLVNKGYVDGSSGSPIYRDLRANFIWADAIATNGTASSNLYLGADSEIRATARSGYNNGSPIYRSVRAANYYAQGDSVFEASGYAVLRASGGIAYIQSDTEARVTKVAAGSSYIAIKASTFTPISLVKYKQDIKPMEESALAIINVTDINEYRLKSEVESGIDKINYGFVIGEGFSTPQQLIDSSREGINLYSALSIAYKGIQEISATQQQEILTRAQLEARILELENKVKRMEAA